MWEKWWEKRSIWEGCGCGRRKEDVWKEMRSVGEGESVFVKKKMSESESESEV